MNDYPLNNHFYVRGKLYYAWSELNNPALPWFFGVSKKGPRVPVLHQWISSIPYFVFIQILFRWNKQVLAKLILSWVTGYCLLFQLVPGITTRLYYNIFLNLDVCTYNKTSTTIRQWRWGFNNRFWMDSSTHTLRISWPYHKHHQLICEYSAN
jgi:hypothetical protein